MLSIAAKILWMYPVMHGIHKNMCKYHVLQHLLLTARYKHHYLNWKPPGLLFCNKRGLKDGYYMKSQFEQTESKVVVVVSFIIL